MTKTVLVVEGNLPELALAQRRATGQTYWELFEAAFASLAPDVQVDVAKPYFSEFDQDACDLSAYDGMAITGSGVDWDAADERAAPFRDLLDKAFAAGTPVYGSCWGLQLGAVVLGGEVGASPNGVEVGVAREVTPMDHQLHQGRHGAFDALCMHRDEVTRAPTGAVVTAANAHSPVQAMAYDEGAVSFWGAQFHPECRLAEAAYWLTLGGGDKRLARDLPKIAEDPSLFADLCAFHQIGLDLLDRNYHLTEIRNWLNARVL